MNKRKQKMFGRKIRQVASLGHKAGDIMSEVGGVASLAGQPEFGTPLMLVGGLTGQASKLLKQSNKKKKKK
jgi:hypothetical protein